MNGTVQINYASSLTSTITATVDPPPPIYSVVNGNQLVRVTFNSDKVTLSGFNINLTNLNNGWSSSSGENYSCAEVKSKGNACQILLNFAPTVVMSGTLNLPFTYINDQNKNDTGTVLIKYNGTPNNVGNIVIPNGPSYVSTIQFGSANVTYNFNTDFGSATNLSIDLTNLSNKYPGWSSRSGLIYKCALVVQAGNLCQLNLNFNPNSLADNNTLKIPYTYTNSANETVTGNLITDVTHVSA
jgi:hypothetical protein